MAATGYTPISLYYSTTASAVPTAGNLANGELALNIADMKLYAKNSAGTVTLLASNASTTGVDSLSFGSTGLTPSTATTGAITVAGTLNVANGGTGQTSFTAGTVLYGNGTSGISASSNLFFDGANGRLGVGTNTPSVRLDVTDSRAGFYVSRFFNTSATGYGIKIKNGLDTNDALRISNAADSQDNILMYGNGNAYFAGNVGIGTSSPAAKLDTAGTIRSTTQTVPASGTGAELYYDASYAGLRGYNRTGSAYVNLALNDNVYIIGGSAGNVGFGTSSPAAKIHAVGTVRSSNSAGTIYTSLATDGIYSSGTDLYLLAPSGYSTIFYTNNTEKFRFGTAGQLGIGGANYGTAGQVLTSGGSGAAPTWSTVAAGGFSTMVTYTSSTTFTIPSGKTSIKVTVIGGGGGARNGSKGGGYGGGGGGGAAIQYFTGLTPGNTLTVTVGAGGAVGGSAGGTTSVSSGTQVITTVQATGGDGAPSNQQGAAGGIGSGGAANIKGGSSTGVQGASERQGGIGGNSIYGGGGKGGVNATSNGEAGGAYGGGGGGGAGGSRAGGAGAAGAVIIEY